MAGLPSLALAEEAAAQQGSAGRRVVAVVVSRPAVLRHISKLCCGASTSKAVVQRLARRSGCGAAMGCAGS